MSGGPKFEYLWADGHKYKKPTSLPANQYISNLIDWIESQINNDTIFPVTVGKQTLLIKLSYNFVYFIEFFLQMCLFPKHLSLFARKFSQDYLEFLFMFTFITLIELFQLEPYVTFYHNRTTIVWILSLQEAHVNTCYKHYYYFVNEFNLIAPKEFEPLKEMTEKICCDPYDTPDYATTSDK